MSKMLTFEGADEFKETLSNLKERESLIVKPAMKKATKVILDEMKSLAPYDKKGHKSIYGEGHLRDEIPVSEDNSQRGLYKAEIGWNKDDNSPHFYAKFHEWGTSRMRARPFISKAFIRKKKEAEDILIENVRRGIENEYK